MRAVVLRQHGGLENLQLVEDHPKPPAVEGHVVIRVRASSFNYHDVFTVKGMPGIKVPLPIVIGLDMAGEIAELGPGVTGWKIGERVLVNPVNKKKGLMGEMLDGGMEEFCLIAADQLIHIPDSVSFEDAASLPVAYGTAHRMLVTHNTVKQGDRVLILGASGGVGTGCVILSKLLSRHIDTRGMPIIEQEWEMLLFAGRNGIGWRIPHPEGFDHPDVLIVLGAATLGTTRLIDNVDVIRKDGED
jgi:alcohol dehydrogenase